MNPYTKCGVMSLLLKEVVRFYSPIGKVWCVSIGGRQIGWIRRGDTIKGWHQYTAISIMGCEYGEFDNFMQALSLFIDQFTGFQSYKVHGYSLCERGNRSILHHQRSTIR
jgi:hypothetical protein